MSDTTHEDSTAQVSVKRWRRFAVDRLYVNDGDGGAIGSFDLRTGAQVINLPAQTVLFEKAVAEWLNSHPEVTRSSTVVPVSESSGAEEPPVSREPPASPGRAVAIDQTGTAGTPSDSDEPGTDLAKNLLGQSVRAQAIACQRDQPVLTWFARVLGVHTDERAWRMGEKGEKLVGNELARLGEGWHVLHSIPVGDNGSDIDHLVIGPAGVFSLNAKHHFDSSIWVAGNVFMVNGRRQPSLRNSRHEAHRVGKLLSAACKMPIGARGVIVVVNADSLTIKEQPVGVDVLYRRQLRRWLEKQPVLLETTSVEQIFDVARRSSTWAQLSGR